MSSRYTAHITLRGYDNASYTGTLVLGNLSLPLPAGWPHVGGSANNSDSEPGGSSGLDDPAGASYYVIAVVLVYGMSIIMLIASHIKRKNAKQVQDKQIDKYLEEFQVVREKSSRDSYRTLKKTIIARLTKERKRTYANLSRAILPVVAVGMPLWGSESVIDSEEARSTDSDRTRPRDPGQRYWLEQELGGISNWELMRAVAGPDTPRPRTNSFCSADREMQDARPRTRSSVIPPEAQPIALERPRPSWEPFAAENRGSNAPRNVRMTIAEIPELQVSPAAREDMAGFGPEPIAVAQDSARLRVPPLYPCGPPPRRPVHAEQEAQHDSSEVVPLMQTLPSPTGFYPSPNSSPRGSYRSRSPSLGGSRRGSRPRSQSPSPRNSRASSRSPTLHVGTGSDPYSNGAAYGQNTGFDWDTGQPLQITCL